MNRTKKYNVKNIPDKGMIRNIASGCNCSLVVAALLIQRGSDTEELASVFLEPKLNMMHDPFLLPDIEKAIEILVEAKDTDKKLVVFGDYDVDGMTSTAVIYNTLLSLGYNITSRLPDRLNAGYDISESVIREIILEGCDILITCDCGSNAHDAINFAVSKGIKVIVTDHHKITNGAVSSHALINPHREDSGYPFKYLSGVGVAFKVMHALVIHLGYEKSSFIKTTLDLVCLGTIADVVPLVGENRIFVINGLKELFNSRLGLKELLAKNNVTKDSISCQALSYRVIPKLNSASRMGNVTKAFDLLVEKDQTKVERLMNSIDEMNTMRITEEMIIMQEAEKAISDNNLSGDNVIVISGDWRHSIVGNIAAKLSRVYRRPVIVIGLQNPDGFAIGSGRDASDINMLSLINGCSDLLVRFGGHKSAAGITIDINKIDEFREKINLLYKDRAFDDEHSDDLDVDLSIKIDAVDLELAQSLMVLEPFGEGNEKPVFLSKSVVINQMMRMGKNKEHLKIVTSKSNGDLLDCLYWNMADTSGDYNIGDLIDIVYNIEINTWSNMSRAQLIIMDMQPSV